MANELEARTGLNVTGAADVTGNLTVGGNATITGSVLGSINSPGFLNNIGMTFASNILKITQAGGSVFSTGASKGQIAIPSTTDGRTVVLDLTTDTHLIEDDGGTSDIVGEQFGVTTAIAWGDDRPFYLYACVEDADASIKFAISPRPNASVVPATTNIGWHGNPGATPSDENFFFLNSTDPSTAFDTNPCVLIGGIRMRMAVTTDDWTIQTLDWASGDGIRSDPFVVASFAMPLSQMGSESGNYFATTNAPVWATAADIDYGYSMGLDGFCTLSLNTVSAGDVTDGGDTVALAVAAPYALKGVHGGTDREFHPSGRYIAGGATSAAGPAVCVFLPGATTFGVMSTNSGNIQNGFFDAGGDELNLTFRYRAF